MSKGEFVADMETIRKRAREHMQDGAVSASYKGDAAAAIKVLNDSLATELVCVMRYKRHHYMAKGINSEPIAAEFWEHALEEMDHADRIAKRIVQLGGQPDFNPASLTVRSHSQYVEGDSLVDMVTEDLVAERIAIDTYREIVKYFGDDDSTSRRLIESILEKEEEHAEDMASLIGQLGRTSSNGSKQ